MLFYIKNELHTKNQLVRFVSWINFFGIIKLAIFSKEDFQSLQNLSIIFVSIISFSGKYTIQHDFETKSLFLVGYQYSFVRSSFNFDSRVQIYLSGTTKCNNRRGIL